MKALKSATRDIPTEPEGRRPQADAAPAPAFHYIMVVWGDHYVDMLLDLALPTFLAPGNLPALSNLAESQFLIFTTPRDRARIEASLVFAHLQRLIEVKFLPSPWIDGEMSYHLKAAEGHRIGTEIAAKTRGYCIYLCPDCVISEGSLRYLEQMARSGKRAVMTPGLRLVTETVYPVLTAHSADAGTHYLSLTGRKLVELGVGHLHPEVQRYNWLHPQFSHHPVMCTWNVPGDRGLLVRAFHLHPILVSTDVMKDFASLDRSTIDGDFLGSNLSDWDGIHVETDSDNFLIFSLTSRQERIWTPVDAKPDLKKLAELAYSFAVNPLHRYYFTKGIKLHTGDLDERWARVEHETGKLVYPVLAEIPKLEPAPAASDQLLAEAPLGRLLREFGKRAKRRASRSLTKVLPVISRG